MPGISVSVDGLLNQLSSPDFFEREEAVKQLSQYDSDEAIAGLVMALEDEDRGIRELASDFLVKMGGDTCSRLLTGFMEHNDISVRNLAAEILVKIGPEAIPSLVDALSHAHHDIRKFALDVLAMIKDHSVAERVIPLLNDDNENVACSAAETLGYIGAEESVEPLLEAFETRECLRPQAAEALGRIGSPRALSKLCAHIQDTDPVVAYSVVEAIGHLGRPEAIDELMPLLNSDNELIANVAMASIIRLSNVAGAQRHSLFTNARLKKFLIESLNSDDDANVRFALQELRHWNEPEIVEELIRLIIKSEGEIVDQVVEILRTVGEPVVEAMRDILEQVSDDERLKLLSAVSNSADIRMAGVVKSYASSSNAEVRQKVAETLGRCGTRESLSPLRQLAKDVVGHVRSAAVKSIGWLGAEDKDVDLLIECLDDDYPDVREAAVGAMILVGNRKVIDTFKQDLNHPNPERPRLAAIALGMIGEEETREPLLMALSHADPAVRRSALEALTRLGGIEDIEPIRICLNDENSLVRKAAVTALVSFEGIQAIDDIKSLLHDDDLWVRYHVIDTIGSLGNPSHSSLILPFLQDDQDILKIMAIKALAEMGDKSCLEHLYNVSAEGNQDIETAVSEAAHILLENGVHG